MKQPVELIETLISRVLPAGDYAYEIKKAVGLGFFDFSTLEKRHFYCAEELRFNQRLDDSESTVTREWARNRQGMPSPLTLSHVVGEGGEVSLCDVYFD